MAKNILVFADGTGNEGGLLPDESRTNVYKLYRATRTGPDSVIDPKKQLAFYVPGIGTPSPRHDTVLDHLKETISQMFGCGLTQKIIDCYVAILSVWEKDDRIYLFGFSRGAYTVRCLAHVLEVCGIPTKEPRSDVLSLDPRSLRKLAKAAAGCLYISGMPIADEKKLAVKANNFRRDYAPLLGADTGASAFFTHPPDLTFGDMVGDHVEGITNNAVTMLDTRALQSPDDNLCDLLAHGSEPPDVRAAACASPAEASL
jgi:hypothetical protein